MKLMVGLLACTLLVAADDKAKGKKDEKSVLGSWEVTSVVRGGKEAKDMKGDTFTFDKDGKLSIKSKNRVEASTYKLDASKDPAEMDLRPSGPGAPPDLVVKAIYSVKGDEMKLCFVANEKAERPKEFESKTDSMVILATLKRSKS
jgi:uncharacterized protein (TIGR03067 family)